MPKSIDTFPGLSRACKVDKDHIPIGARIVIATINSEGRNERRRIVQYDLSKIKEQECADAFRAKLRDFPVLGVEVENSSHCHLIQNYVQEALLEGFPMSKCKKKKEYITDSTFAVIKEGRVLGKKSSDLAESLADLVSEPYL